MSAPQYLAAFLVAIIVLVTIHELGHYWVARLCGVKILRFSLGFGRVMRVWHSGKDRTEWALSMIPLGGYVKMLDEREGPVPLAERHRSFNAQPLYRRSLIVVAGPLANLILASVIYWAIACTGTREFPPVLGEVNQASPAQRAGLLAGDRIVSVGGEAVRSWSEMRWQFIYQAVAGHQVNLVIERGGVQRSDVVLDGRGVTVDEHAPDPMQQLGVLPVLPRIAPVIGGFAKESPGREGGLRIGDRVTRIDGARIEHWGQLVKRVAVAPGKPMQFVVLRQGQELALTVTPMAASGNAARGLLGVTNRADEQAFFAATEVVRYGAVEGLLHGVSQTWETAVFSLRVMWRILCGAISVRNVSGPLTIASYAGQSASIGLGAYMSFLALISVSIGVLNLLPIPILDGGHLLYHAAELIRGRPLPERVEEYGQRIGLALLAGLMALAFFNDFNRFFFG